MKCKHCGKVWSIAQSVSLPYECPFCRQNLQIIIENPDAAVTAPEMVKRLVDAYGDDIIMNKRIFLALFGDLAPHLKKERKIFSAAMTSDVMKLFERCSEDEQKKRISRVRMILDMLSEESVYLFINCMGEAVGWKKIENKSENQAKDTTENNVSKTAGTNSTYDNKPLTTAEKAQRGDIKSIHQMIDSSNETEEIIKWAKLGVSFGCEKCAFVLGKAYMRDSNHYLDAIRNLENSADAGYTPAAAYLGKKLLQLNITGDAKKWLMKASEEGDSESMYFLANIYYQEKNEKQALYWAKKSADEGELDGCLLYGTLLSMSSDKKEMEDAVRYLAAFLKTASESHVSYNDTKQVLTGLVERYNKKYNNNSQTADSQAETSSNDTSANQVPTPCSYNSGKSKVPNIPIKKALIHILEKYENEFKSMPALYVVDSAKCNNDTSYSKKTYKKMKTAINTYAKEAVKEQVIAVIDHTVFGSAKDGAILTDKTIYSKNTFKNESVKLSDIVNIEPVYSYKTKLWSLNIEYKKSSDDMVVTVFGGSSENDMKKMAKMLSSYVKEANKYIINDQNTGSAYSSLQDVNNQIDVEQVLSPYVTKFNAMHNVCVYFPACSEYKNDLNYRTYVDYALSEHKTTIKNNLSNSNEKILAITILKTPGFFITNKNLYTTSLKVPLNKLKGVTLEDNDMISIVKVSYENMNNSIAKSIIFAGMNEDKDDLQIVKDMIESLVNAVNS